MYIVRVDFDGLKFNGVEKTVYITLWYMYVQCRSQDIYVYIEKSPVKYTRLACSTRQLLCDIYIGILYFSLGEQELC